MKDVTIYESKLVRVYINQCHNKGKKTRVYAVRSDDTTGCMALLGVIKWSGAWRQYIFEPEREIQTQWSAGCQEGISSFMRARTKEEYAKWRKNSRN